MYLKVLVRRKFAYRRKVLVTACIGRTAGPIGGWYACYGRTPVAGVRMDAAASAAAALAHRIYLPKIIDTMGYAKWECVIATK